VEKTLKFEFCTQTLIFFVFAAHFPTQKQKLLKTFKTFPMLHIPMTTLIKRFTKGNCLNAFFAKTFCRLSFPIINYSIHMMMVTLVTHLLLQLRTGRHCVHDGFGQLSVEIFNDRLDAVLVAHRQQKIGDGFGKGGPVGVQAAQELSEAASVEMCQKQTLGFCGGHH
jgi:hypothetical protein